MGVYNVYCVLCTVYCVLFRACTIQSVYYSESVLFRECVYTMYCVLWTVYCVLCAVYCVLCTVYCVLCAVYCVLCTVYCVLCTVYCVLCTVYCVLCTVYCVLCTVYCVLLCTSLSPWTGKDLLYFSDSESEPTDGGSRLICGWVGCNVCVLCTVYCVLCTVYCVLCTVYLPRK
jgi:hypothetical protein